MRGRYYSLGEYLKNEFGCKPCKLALDGGMTCPTRDGALGARGCIFCSSAGGGEFAAAREKSVSRQIDRAIKLVGDKSRCDRYIAYFQSFTNTYAPAEYLDALFSEAVADERICALSVATRPDCLPDGAMRVLEKMSKIKPLWVELGLQTVHEDTARYIRRGYALPVYDEAVVKLHAIGAHVVTHVIIGLPGEDAEASRQTALYVGKRTDGVKLQLLHVLRDSDLYAEYLAGRVPVMTLEGYISALEGCVEALPESVVIHRLTGDGAKKNLVAPLWSADKKRVINAVAAAFERDGVVQGKRAQSQNPD